MSDLKKDIQSGKIKALKLIESTNVFIRSNCNALMFGVERDIIDWDEERFYLETETLPIQGLYELTNGAYSLTDIVKARHENDWCLCEAYYSVFKYDGKRLVHEEEIPNAVYGKNRLSRTVYEVIRRKNG